MFRAILIAALLLPTPSFAQSREQFVQLVIEESVQDYLENHGNCPCDYNRAKNGSRCGKRSAWSRAGGESPACYPSDVTDAMIEDYKRRH